MALRSVLPGVSVKATTVIIATERKPTRDYHCPVAHCGRFLTTSTATEGMIRVKCESCKSWHWFRLGIDGKPSRP